MKKISFLMMLLLMSSFATSQTLSTSQLSETVQITKRQVTELFKISKQNDFLKELSAKQEKELNAASALITDQKKSLQKCNDLVALKDDFLANREYQLKTEIEIRDVEIKRMKDLEILNQKQQVKANRKSFWNGFSVGGVSVAILGSLVLILK